MCVVYTRYSTVRVPGLFKPVGYDHDDRVTPRPNERDGPRNCITKVYGVVDA
jgi:hypothetical protein